MKFHLVAALLSCALLSLSYAEVAETEKILAPLVEVVPKNVDSPADVVAEPVPVGSAEIQKVLTQIPESAQATPGEESRNIEPVEEVVDSQTERTVNVKIPESVQDTPVEESSNVEPVEEVAKNTEAIVDSQTERTVNNRKSKQLIGFIPSSVLRHAIRMAQQQHYNEVRSFMNDNEDYRSSDEVEEERSVRRRKRFRTRTSNDHLKHTRRHKNTNHHSMNKRKNSHGNRRTHNRRGNTQNVTRQKETRRPLRRVRTKRKRGNKRGY